MATVTMTYHNRVYDPRRMLFALIIVFAAAACSYCAHAVARHGSDAEAVRKCLEDNDPLQMWVKMDGSGRVILLCKLTDGRFGLQFRDSSGKREITSLIKNKLTRLSQVEQYLRNIGAERIYYP